MGARGGRGGLGGEHWPQRCVLGGGRFGGEGARVAATRDVSGS